MKKPEHSLSIGWWVSLGGIFLVSVLLRFWGLERFNTLVFDEVYYAKFAHNYLSHTPFFDGHPPLSKYIIAGGMWLGNHLPVGQDTVNDLAGATYSTWSYRWLNALTGSFIPWVMAGIVYQISRRSRFALIAGGLAALDGLFLVESRYALNNVYLVMFGLLGWWTLLRSLTVASGLQRSFWWVLSGCLFSASVSVKWNGLWFLLGLYGLWIVAHGIVSQRQQGPEEIDSPRSPCPDLLVMLTRLRWWHMGLYFGVVPICFYVLAWIPHLQMNHTLGFWPDFWELQRQILTYHERVGDGPKVHPYCARWFTWILMIRPLAYFYQVTVPGAPLPNGTSRLTATTNSVIYDVHAMGNPMLWWFSTAAVLLILIVLVQQAQTWWQGRHHSAATAAVEVPLRPSELGVALFITVNYGAQLVPWIPVTRCTFLYHYMGASVFASLAIAWLLDRWLQSRQSHLRTLGIATLLLIGLGFVFWLPLYLGLPLSLGGWQARMWLPTWI